MADQLRDFLLKLCVLKANPFKKISISAIFIHKFLGLGVPITESRDLFVVWPRALLDKDQDRLYDS